MKRIEIILEMKQLTIIDPEYLDYLMNCSFKNLIKRFYSLKLYLK